jgi:cytochrome P450
MKVQKMVSLDETTARLASDIKNFSRFVRIAVLAHSMGDNIEEERRLRRQWKRVADYLMGVIEYETDMDEEERQDVFMAALAAARNQEELGIE